MGCRRGPTVTTGSLTAITAPEWIMPSTRGQPVRPNTPVRFGSRRGSWPPTVIRSRWRIAPSRPGRGCGVSGSPYSAPACWLLRQRTHHCPHCGLRADRDIVSAMLACCVQLADPDDPHTAWVDYQLAHALRAWLASQQEWEGSVNRHQPPPHGGGSARTGSRHPVASAEQAALGPPPNRPGLHLDVADPVENNSTPSCLALHDPLRVNS